jgi:epoxide hydrolase
MRATRPQTRAPAVADSPAGMLAWVLDVVNTFKDPAKATPSDAIDCDMLLTNLSILWFTNTTGSSMRLCKESQHWGWSSPIPVCPPASRSSRATTRSAASPRSRTPW